VNWKKGFQFGLLIFSVSGILFGATNAFASDKGNVPAGKGGNSIKSSPGLDGAKPGSLAHVPETERVSIVIVDSTLGLSDIAMKTGAYWISFICAATILVGMQMSAVPSKD